jgi:hypothetical protein
VFYHDLLISKLHYIDYQKATDGIHGSKDMVHGFYNIQFSQGEGRMKHLRAPCQKVPSLSPPCHAEITLLMPEFCDPTSGSCVVSGEVDMRDGNKNSTVVGASNKLLECHGEPENHNLLHDHGKYTCSLWEIYADAMRKKMGRIGSFLISQCQTFEIYHPYCSFYLPQPRLKIKEKAEQYY